MVFRIRGLETARLRGKITGAARGAVVESNVSGQRLLYSDDIPIAGISADGKIARFWDGWSIRAGFHIRKFCGLNKRKFKALQLESLGFKY